MSGKVLLLYGYGSNVGTQVVKKFASNGWKTAAIVRTLKEEYKDSADIVLQADFTDYTSIQKVYHEVESKLGTPTCVVYNAYANEGRPQNAENPFSAASSAQFAADLAANTVGFHAAAAAAVAGFEKPSAASQDAPRTFIFTGNALPTLLVPETASLGVGKAASAYLIELASHAFRGRSRWYYADERLAGGLPVANGVSGVAHADAFFHLATAPGQEPWNYTFVAGAGYRRFADARDRQYMTFKQILEASQA